MFQFPNATLQKMHLLAAFCAKSKFCESLFKTQNWIYDYKLYMCEPHFASLKCDILEVCFRDTAYGVPHGRDESEKPANVQFAI